ncbi:prolyl oligopeptidase family serine peptidase [Pontiella sulfatireligans]|uniref:Dipeptidyl aminopeptidase 4 n=1 Tax=Pontiella sulfatireligans TaxID=2750658 RepID=A0A6C2UGU2_9BACT|nr:prolyl oligopeptidase family serine peptidase [Pontiella sulfatireligans]VGO19073.1 Dipeptidyl aminopeptidase 4 [Pontiella sulfatireligans]
MQQIFITFVFLGLVAGTGFGFADFESARSLKKRTQGSMEDATIEPVWAPDDSALYYQQQGSIVRIDTQTGTKESVLDAKQLNGRFDGKQPVIQRFKITEDGSITCLADVGGVIRVLRVEEGGIRPVAPEKDPFALLAHKSAKNLKSGKGSGASKIYFVNNSSEPGEIVWVSGTGEHKTYVTLEPGETYVQNTHAGHLFSCGEVAFRAEKKPGVAYLGSEPEKQTGSTTDPRQWKAEFKDYNLHVTNRKTGKTMQLTSDGSEGWKYRGPGHWSPDGKYVVVFREKKGTDRHIDIIESAPKGQLQPRTKSIRYLKPGDELDVATPCLFDLRTGTEITLDNSLFSNPWNITRLHWAPDRFFFLYNERGHQTLRLVAVQAATGKTATLIEETSPTFIDYSQKTFLHQLDETDEAIWMSERSGWNHLYLVNRKTGKTKPITAGEWVVREVEHVDPEKRQLWLRVFGVYKDQDSCYSHFARVNFDGSDFTILTEGNGEHEVAFSGNRKFLVDTWSRVDHPPAQELRRSADGQKVTDLGTADTSKLLAIHPHLPEPFVTKGRDGKTDIHGVIFRPSHFDSKKKYPVIESIYAGPHGFFVPKKFSAYHGPQQMAELGFIVVKIDGMGTNWRSRTFHDVCWKNLKDSGFPDRIAWLKAAAKKYPYMDLSRVGIYGGSAGGQSAMRAVLDYSDFYKAAAADCGCHDNRMDKIWWNEAWMGWPVDESYEKSSNLADAYKLGGKLLLTVGMMDTNVDPSSTMQVVEALIKAGKEFEFIPFPSRGHGAGGSNYGVQQRAEFFIRHLGTCDLPPGES